MGFLIVLAPIAVILLFCGSMYFFMRRGMEGEGRQKSAHGMNGNQQTTGAGEAERLRQLDSDVGPLPEPVAVSGKGPSGTEPALTGLDPTGRKSGS